MLHRRVAGLAGIENVVVVQVGPHLDLRVPSIRGDNAEHETPVVLRLSLGVLRVGAALIGMGAFVRVLGRSLVIALIRSAPRTRTAVGRVAEIWVLTGTSEVRVDVLLADRLA